MNPNSPTILELASLALLLCLLLIAAYIVTWRQYKAVSHRDLPPGAASNDEIQRQAEAARKRNAVKVLSFLCLCPAGIVLAYAAILYAPTLGISIFSFVTMLAAITTWALGIDFIKILPDKLRKNFSYLTVIGFVVSFAFVILSRIIFDPSQWPALIELFSS